LSTLADSTRGVKTLRVHFEMIVGTALDEPFCRSDTPHVPVDRPISRLVIAKLYVAVLLGFGMPDGIQEKSCKAVAMTLIFNSTGV
jgi:hypothetical protein